MTTIDPTSLFLIGHALAEKDYKSALSESITMVGSHLPGGKYLEVGSLVLSTAECIDINADLKKVDDAYRYYQAKP